MIATAGTVVLVAQSVSSAGGQLLEVDFAVSNPDGFVEAIRAAKVAAGLDPDTPQKPSEFQEHIPHEYKARFWSEVVERKIRTALVDRNIPEVTDE